ncbi:MAG TPA: sensor domain-containing diguanylate cyclase, partial [Halomonas sp.]|nr:sensor domain-containing diguanylate cyclase [Halomonas sp.]
IQVIEEPLHVGSATLRVSTSIGVALFVPNAAETPQELLKRADDAMYNAKRAGKARVALARPADTPNPL